MRIEVQELLEKVPFLVKIPSFIGAHFLNGVDVILVAFFAFDDILIIPEIIEPCFGNGKKEIHCGHESLQRNTIQAAHIRSRHEVAMAVVGFSPDIYVPVRDHLIFVIMPEEVQIGKGILGKAGICLSEPGRENVFVVQAELLDEHAVNNKGYKNFVKTAERAQSV